jgi:hypothetical protein
MLASDILTNAIYDYKLTVARIELKTNNTMLCDFSLPIAQCHRQQKTEERNSTMNAKRTNWSLNLSTSRLHAYKRASYLGLAYLRASKMLHASCEPLVPGRSLIRRTESACARFACSYSLLVRLAICVYIRMLTDTKVQSPLNSL